jgi:hypothetical protein
MKHIKSKSIFESKYDRRKELQNDILDTIRDILLEANDIDIKTNVYKTKLYKNKAVIALTPHKNTRIRFNDIEDVIDRILEYLKMNSCIHISMSMDDHIIINDADERFHIDTYRKRYIPVTMRGCVIYFSLPTGL